MTVPDSFYPSVARDFETTLRKVRDDQWHLATPCELWDCEQLVRHVIDTHQRVTATITGDTPSFESGQDLLAVWQSSHALVLELVSDESVAAMLVHGVGREQSFASLVGGLLTFDTLCHSWDLARSIGADEQLNAEAVAYAHQALAAVGDAIRSPEGFGPAITPSAGASEQTRFLNYLGRRV